ncbi:uncharacterized protein ATC70_000276 [Mucor velutinosus]|uniref:Uncharacterized protein n=1 Tax=Mucor velutinosus TaxID=708070 RepID=A0AAN7DH64_9FUNG|nr:hypothetical protein ATC70_000276 [Mucor velutinosus]
MGFLSFRKKSKASKALNSTSLPPPLVLTDSIRTSTSTDAGSDYRSFIADSFMMVGNSIVDMAQSSLSEDIFKELVPLSIKSESSMKSKDTIRHSLSLKPNNSSARSSISPLKFSTAIQTHNDNIQSPLTESIISNATRSSKQSDSSDSSFTSLSSTEEFVPLHPVSRSDPHHYDGKKLGEHVPLMDLLDRSQAHEQIVASKTPSAAAISVPGLAMARMKERHRQEYRRSMQRPLPTQPLPNISSSTAAIVDYHPTCYKKTNSFTSQRIHPMQHQLSPPSSPSSASLLVHARTQVPLVNQIKPAVAPMRSMSSSTHTSKPFDRRPLIANIPSPVNYQLSKPVVPVSDHRHYYLLNQAQHPPLTAAVQRPHEIPCKANHNCHPRQRMVGITECHYQQQLQQEPHDVGLSSSSKLKTDYRRIVYSRKQDYVPDLVDLLNHQEEQQQQVDEKSSFSRCSHHQPHHTLIKRQYNNTIGCQQAKQQQQHHYSTTHRCSHHHHYTRCHHRKPATCCNTCC